MIKGENYIRVLIDVNKLFIKFYSCEKKIWKGRNFFNKSKVVYWNLNIIYRGEIINFFVKIGNKKSMFIIYFYLKFLFNILNIVESVIVCIKGSKDLYVVLFRIIKGVY